MCFLNLEAQNKTHATPIADKTFMSASGENNIKVKCSNEKITSLLLKKFNKKVFKVQCGV